MAVVVATLDPLLVDAGLHDQRRLLLDRDTFLDPPPERLPPLPVLAHLSGAGEWARMVAPRLADAVAALASGARWTQTGTYVDDPPNGDFLERYAHATVTGPADGGAPTVVASAAAVSLGFLLLGPDVVYPPHQHPADEVYLPLDDADWWEEEAESYLPRPSGQLIHHGSGQAHGMRTAGRPLLALYLWTGDVVTPATFC